MITNSDLDLITRDALDALAAREAAATPAPPTPCPADDDRDESSRDAM